MNGNLMVSLLELEAASKREQYYHSVYAILTSNRPPMSSVDYRAMSELARKVWIMYCDAQEEVRVMKNKALDSSL
jgi:hypothetical protein